MTTTTQVTNISDKLDLTAFAGDFITEYDIDAVHRDYVSELACKLPEGITLCNNGDVIADVELADDARDLDWDYLASLVPVADIFERNQVLTAFAHAEDIDDAGNAWIRIRNTTTDDEVAAISYAPAEDLSEALGNIQDALANAQYKTDGEWVDPFTARTDLHDFRGLRAPVAPVSRA